MGIKRSGKEERIKIDYRRRRTGVDLNSSKVDKHVEHFVAEPAEIIQSASALS